MKDIARALTRLGVFTAHPTAFIVVLGYVVLWIIFSPSSFDWHAGAAVATLFMTLLIQRAEHRDTQALHAKLDELLRAKGKARSELTHIDEQEPETIQQHRFQERVNESRPPF